MAAAAMIGCATGSGIPILLVERLRGRLHPGVAPLLHVQSYAAGIYGNGGLIVEVVAGLDLDVHLGDAGHQSDRRAYELRFRQAAREDR